VDDCASGVRGFSSRSYFSVHSDSVGIWTTHFLSDHDLFSSIQDHFAHVPRGALTPVHRSPDLKTVFYL